MLELKSGMSILAAGLLLAACSAEQASAPSAETAAESAPAAVEEAAPAVATVEVMPVLETVPVASIDDAADDPAIWRHPQDPALSLIVGTDKDAGLNVYAMDGSLKSFMQAGLVNNVDLRQDISFGGGEMGVVVGASDRNDIANGVMALYRLDTQAGTLEEIVKAPAITGEAYGFCFYRRPADGGLYAFINSTAGLIEQIQIDLTGDTPVTTNVRSLQVPTQPEGCVVDDRTGVLYVGEEAAGIWRFDAAPDGDTAGVMIAQVDSQILFADVEGLTVAPLGDAGGYLVASSQGDAAFSVFDLETTDFVGRFRIVDNGAGVDGTFETDGIDLMLGDFGPQFPGGIFVAQDGDNAPDTQNFKYVSWDAVRAALNLR